jgi:hypothetical protein
VGIGGSKRGACKVVRFITQTINVMGGSLSKKTVRRKKTLHDANFTRRLMIFGLVHFPLASS